MSTHGRHTHHYRANARMRAARRVLLTVMGLLLVAAVLSPLLGGPSAGGTPTPYPAPARTSRDENGRRYPPHRSSCRARCSGRRLRHLWRSRSGTSARWLTGPRQSHATGRTPAGTPSRSRRKSSR